jgi:hypothetical protein
MWWFAGWFTLAMFGAALQPKALGLSIVFAVGLAALYPNSDQAGLLTVFYLAAYILAGVRE